MTIDKSTLWIDIKMLERQNSMWFMLYIHSSTSATQLHGLNFTSKNKHVTPKNMHKEQFLRVIDI